MYTESVLKNGLKVVTERVDTVQSVSVGVFVGAGARHENTQNNGVAHFLEHMAFKGTERRSALDIAKETENVGAFMNAYTSRESTVYYLKVMKENTELAVDILGDILLNSTFVQEEMERERGVILQEFGMMQDTPDDMVFEHLQKTFYPDQPIGRHILGTKDTITNMSRDDLQQFINANYTSKNMIIAASGAIDHKELVNLVEQHFANINVGDATTEMKKATYNGGKIVDTKSDLEQVHIALGWQAINYFDDDYYAAHLWNTALGGGMSSRLFQEIREKRGLVYSVFSFLSNYVDDGNFGVYAGTSAKDVPELMTVMRDELQKASEEMTEEELLRAKAQLKAGLIMSHESTDSRMSQIARNQMVYGRYIPLEESIQKIESVEIKDCLRAAKTMLNGKEGLAAVGPISEEEIN